MAAIVAAEKIISVDTSAINLKICGVCGDKALGYNFNAVTCESCKAFFRRNALTTKEFRCPFGGECEITVVKRRFCQKCRLEKCFAIGMKKEYIMSEEDKVLKRKKIEQNRAKKKCTRLSEEDVSNKIKRDNSASDDSNDGYRKCNGIIGSDNEQFSSKSNTYNTNILNNKIAVNECTENIRFVDSKSEIILSEVRIGTKNNIKYISNNVELSSSHSSTSSPPETFQYMEMNSEDSDSYQNGDTMIRTILNPTPKINSPDPILSELIRSDVQCRNQKSHYNQTPADENQATPIDVTRDVLQDVQRIPIEPNSIESILCEAIKLEFEAYTSIATSHTNNSRELNDAERAKLNELIVANKALLQPVDDDVTYVAEDGRFKATTAHSTNAPVLLDIINLTAVAIRRLIKMAKKINAFKNMCQEDQVALLKGGCTEMMILRSAMTYDLTRESWKIPHSQESLSRIKVDVLKQAKGNIYQEHERFIKTFDPRWRMDENIILILCAITLFTPDRPRVIHNDVIKLEQNSYYYLLRRYLESIYQGCEAKSTFLKLIQKISELHKLNGEVIGVYLDVNPSDVEPLLIEIFDLKPHC